MIKKSKEIRKDHYIISSYPKSGNTLVRLILQDYFYGKTDLDSIDKDIPYIGKNSFKEKSLLKSHDLPNAYMKRGVYIFRCPVKSSNSLYRSSKRRGLKLSFSVFSLFQYLELLDFYSKPVKHFSKWKTHAQENSFILINYDYLIENTFESLEKIINHYGEKVNKEKLKRSINNCSVENVAKLELKSKKIQSKLQNKGSITGIGFNLKNQSNFFMQQYQNQYERIKL